MDGTSKRWNQVVPSLASAGPAPSAELCDAVRQVAGRGYDVSIGLEPGRASQRRLPFVSPSCAPTHLLEEIAASTGGDYRNLKDVTDLVCGFQQVRNVVATGSRRKCGTDSAVAPGEKRPAKVAVPYGTDQVTFTHTFPGDPVGMAVT